jgi:endonuclease-8
MPEGDTLAKAAARLRPALAGHALTRWEAPRLRGDAPRLGTRIDAVEARGKHLLVHFDADGSGAPLTLRTHLRMTGSWHLYKERERWQKPAYLARAVVGADSGWVAVCFSAPVVETYRRADGAEPVVLAALGPDLCVVDPTDDAVAATVLGRIADAERARPELLLAEALLDQRIAAGIGNVYKSEACYACEVAPGTRLAAVPAELRLRLWQVAARQLQANLGHAERRTHPAGLAVYGRARQPCHRCGTPIEMARQGEQARSSYWCPRCQPTLS